MVDGAFGFIAVSRCRSGRGPIKRATNEARLRPDHFAGNFQRPPVVSGSEQRHGQSVVTPEIDDVVGSKPDCLVGLSHGFADLSTQGEKHGNVAMAGWVDRVEADRMLAFGDRLVDTAGTFQSE